ncbi:unnamed protein product [Protopolystoma xenopodis]|uniref:Uncharacterized protein n=1 Tax=Protopolystoma xenopodis TaxID=117903 RepID=A0A3S5A8W0_9PLAT|nr:unnamed protein product [Protopolystoma xenopodis]
MSSITHFEDIKKSSYETRNPSIKGRASTFTREFTKDTEFIELESHCMGKVRCDQDVIIRPPSPHYSDLIRICNNKSPFFGPVRPRLIHTIYVALHTQSCMASSMYPDVLELDI